MTKRLRLHEFDVGVEEKNIDAVRAELGFSYATILPGCISTVWPGM